MSGRSLELELVLAEPLDLPDHDGLSRDWVSQVETVVGDKDYLSGAFSTKADHLVTRSLIAVSGSNPYTLRANLLQLAGFCMTWIRDIDEGTEDEYDDDEA